MKNRILAFLFFLVAFATPDILAQEHFVRTQPITSSEYTVSVNGRKVPVYTAREQYADGVYFFCNFDFKNSADVVVTSTHDLSDVVLLPLNKFKLNEKGSNEVSFHAAKPFRISLEYDGRVRPLLIFGNRPDDHAYVEGDKDVLYFGPGVHHEQCVEVESGQTLYLAEGAVLNAGLWLHGDDITICGKGILAGDDWQNGGRPPLAYMLLADKCRNLTLKDITITNSWGWTMTLSNCDGVTLDNVKLCGSNRISDDAVDICDSRNVTVRNCFLRAQDDIIAVKGIPNRYMKPHEGFYALSAKEKAGENLEDSSDPYPDFYVCENIMVEDSELWTDMANIFRIGFECGATDMRNIVGRNLYVVHPAWNYRVPWHFWCNAVFYIQPSNGMLISNCRFENMRIYSDGRNNMIFAAIKAMRTRGPDSNKVFYKKAGSLDNVTFKDISVEGSRDNFTGSIILEGRSEKESLHRLTFDNVRYFGKKIDSSLEDFMITNYVDYVFK